MEMNAHSQPAAVPLPPSITKKLEDLYLQKQKKLEDLFKDLLEDKREDPLEDSILDRIRQTRQSEEEYQRLRKQSYEKWLQFEAGDQELMRKYEEKKKIYDQRIEAFKRKKMFPPQLAK